ncbi:protein of unknown function [Burkholderia multivorans]
MPSPARRAFRGEPSCRHQPRHLLRGARRLRRTVRAGRRAALHRRRAVERLASLHLRRCGVVLRCARRVLDVLLRRVRGRRRAVLHRIRSRTGGASVIAGRIGARAHLSLRAHAADRRLNVRAGAQRTLRACLGGLGEGCRGSEHRQRGTDQHRMNPGHCDSPLGSCWPARWTMGRRLPRRDMRQVWLETRPPRRRFANLADCYPTFHLLTNRSHSLTCPVARARPTSAPHRSRRARVPARRAV